MRGGRSDRRGARACDGGGVTLAERLGHLAAPDLRQMNQSLLDTAAHLVEERNDLPAGSVLRCFSRAVRHVRQSGCPTPQLAAEAERIARALLSLRTVTSPA